MRRYFVALILSVLLFIGWQAIERRRAEADPALLLALYGQTPIAIAPPALRVPPGIRGMRAEVDALTVKVEAVEAENALLRVEVDTLKARSALLTGGQFGLFGILRLKQGSDLASATGQAVGWQAFVLDISEPGGERGVPRDEHIGDLEDSLMQIEAHMTALSAP